MTNNSIPQSLESMMDSLHLSTVNLLVQGHQFTVHKAILASRSPVLARMLEANQDDEEETPCIEVADISVEVFTELLRFLYTDEVQSLEEVAIELYTAAEKFQVEALKALCLETILTMTLTVANFPALLVFADKHDLAERRQQCIAFYGDHFMEIEPDFEWFSALCSDTTYLLFRTVAGLT